jgi:two-component system, LytTR family, sensor kinase
MPAPPPIHDNSLKLLSIRGILLSIWAIFFLVSFIDALRAITYMRATQQPVIYLSIALHTIGETIYWSLFTWFLVWLLDRWPYRRRALSILLATVLLVLGGLIVTFSNAALFTLSGVSKKSITENILILLPRDFHGSMFLVVVVLGAAISLRDRYMAEQRRVRESRLETQLLQAQLHSVSAQFQPHFLFNTLHAVTALLYKDTKKAEQMITGLGDLLRLSLSHARDEFGTLDDELYFVERYLFLQHMRLANRLAVRIEADDDARRSAFPRFVLQPLVENAVKHGIDPSGEPGEVAITAGADRERLEIQIRNSVPDGLRWKPDGVGLSTVRQRLDLLYGAQHSLDFSTNNGEVLVSIAVPYRANYSPSTSASSLSR